ncbi:MAG TPA: branched-chain-amino-acid transaminase [Fibrobacteraceae bacterium]|nr:branched-chain-amino-acid transaminase [Fibrobacteraceae bacterium]
MTQVVYIDGKFYDKDNAKVSVFDHGYLYGDGVFEGIRAYNGRVFKLDEHVGRLFDSAKVIALNPGVTQDEMKQIILNTCAKNHIRDGYIRPIISRGIGDLGLNPYNCTKATVVCIAGSISLYPEKVYQEGMKIVTVPTPRNNNESLNPRVKSLNYLNNIMAKMEGIHAGAPEALMLNPSGMVAECTGDNIFIIKNGVVHTPNVQSGSLDGITRRTVIDVAKTRGLEVMEGPMSRFDIWVADEFFLTGTAAEVVPIVELDKRSIGNGQVGPLTKALIADFKAFVSQNGTPIPAAD